MANFANRPLVSKTSPSPKGHSAGSEARTHAIFSVLIFSPAPYPVGYLAGRNFAVKNTCIKDYESIWQLFSWSKLSIYLILLVKFVFLQAIEQMLCPILSRPVRSVFMFLRHYLVFKDTNFHNFYFQKVLKFEKLPCSVCLYVQIWVAKP